MTQRDKGLDVLRGVAILLVLLNHAESSAIPGFPAPVGLLGALYWKIKGFGWSGVDLFFVLSGYLISGLLFKEIEITHSLNLKRFWARRAFKIIPSYFLLLFFLALTGATAWLNTSTVLTTLKSVFIHCFFLQDYLQSDVNGPTWSLAVEEQFYLLLPTLLFFIGTKLNWKRNVLISIIAFLFVALLLRISRVLGVPQKDDYMLTHFRLDGLFFGVLCQYLIRTKSKLTSAIAAHKPLSIVVALALISPALFFARPHPFMFTIGFSMLATGYSILLISIVSSGLGKWGQGWMAASIASVGLWSYNIYLWHFFLPGLGLPFYTPVQTFLSVHIPGVALQMLVQFLFFAAVSIGIGAILTKVVENPILALRDKFPALTPPKKPQSGVPLALVPLPAKTP